VSGSRVATEKIFFRLSTSGLRCRSNQNHPSLRSSQRNEETPSSTRSTNEVATDDWTTARSCATTARIGAVPHPCTARAAIR